jgi:uncharacterized protein YecT (DUF1311 family)
MLQIDLTTLRPQELRQLLDTTRQRGQAELTYEILQEMAARRERDEREGRRALFARRKRSEPRTIELNLGDPLGIEDELPPPEEDSWDPPSAVEPEPKPEPDEAIYLEREPPPQRAPKTRPRKAAREPRPAPERRPRRWGWAAVALVFGLAAGSVLGWSFDEIAHDLGLAPTTAADKAPTAAPTVVAQALPPAQPAAPTTAADDPSAIQPEAAAPAPDAASVPASSSQTADATPDSTAAASPPPAAAPIPAPVRDTPPPVETAKADTGKAELGKVDTGKAASVAIASAGPKHCAAEPSPADQTICRDPHLQRLQRDLRDAYATALAAHEDRALLREHQLAWADARNAITDPDKLAQLYEERIRKLNAATADALRQK